MNRRLRRSSEASVRTPGAQVIYVLATTARIPLYSHCPKSASIASETLVDRGL
jgi:hypothetical protein